MKVSTLIGVVAVAFVSSAALAQENKADVCQKNEPKLRKKADQCLGMANLQKRKGCVDSVEQLFPRDVWEQCGEKYEPIRKEYQAKEKQKYPKQASAFRDDGPGRHHDEDRRHDDHARHDGPGHHGPDHGEGRGGLSPKECQAFQPKLKKHADRCLKRRKFSSRKKCFDRAEKKFPREMWDSCQPMLDALSQEIVSQEKKLYPKQPSALRDGEGREDHHADRGDRGHGPDDRREARHEGPRHGDHGPGDRPEHKGWSPEQCQKEVPKLKRAANNCLRIGKFDKRKSCIEKVGEKFPRPFWDSCQAQLDPLKAEMVGKEKSKYPNQPSALADRDDGPDNQAHHDGPGRHDGHGPDDRHEARHDGPDHHKGPAPQCQKLEKKVRKAADRCLKMGKSDKRKACFDRIGDKVIGRKGDSCGPALDPVKQEYAAREKQRYPRQPSSLE